MTAAEPALDQRQLLAAVQQLRGEVAATRLPLVLAGSEAAEGERDRLLKQLDDYVLPRLSALDAPLLAVVGGSTGAGKSTIVNSLVGEVVTRAGVLRPTTRASVLVHHPEDTRWFTDQRVLPGLARVTEPASEQGRRRAQEAAGTTEDPSSVRLVASEHLQPGLALLDAPDIDSVVRANRELARQLLSAADLWLFVTTAARYADAVPWGLLREAAERGTSVAIVLDRVPPEAMAEVRSHLAEMLREHGLAESPVFPVPETRLSREGLLPERDIARLHSWLTSLARDAKARSTVIRRTLTGALDSLPSRVTGIAEAVDGQVEALEALGAAAGTAYADALSEVERGMTDGTLLRGEVLARWQEFVGTGELLRSLENRVGRIRDRLVSAIKGKPQQAEHVTVAVESGLELLILEHAEAAAERAAQLWGQEPGG
ncbi:MAG TPA: dynamin family protein, partial [Segeticoccus sp.]|nr:dynamin family protein [Segeticoccus sp.]